MASIPTFVSFARTEVATTTVACTFVADGAFVTDTLSSGCTLTRAPGAGGGTIAIGNQTIGTYIPIPCTTATFSAGGLIFCKAQ
mgnify:FL=1